MGKPVDEVKGRVTFLIDHPGRRVVAAENVNEADSGNAADLIDAALDNVNGRGPGVGGAAGHRGGRGGGMGEGGKDGMKG